MTTVCYASEITGVGSLVTGFVDDHGILVFFNEQAPAELQDISVFHRPSIERHGPVPGDVVEIGATSFPILAVGDVVERNLIDLGHIDFKANGKVTADLPGDVCVPEHALPQPEVGDAFRITRGGDPRAAPPAAASSAATPSGGEGT